MNNLRIWDKVKRPPETALKQITGGRLRGMTDIKPQWRLEAMTELFGPCGLGWKYEIVSFWPVHTENGESTAFAQINLYYKEGDNWSDPIPGIGGSMLVANEKNGTHVSDEAYKMALTDALSVAMKAIGVGSEIYYGNFDGSKYREPPPKVGQISGKPLDVAKVERAANHIITVIESDITEEERKEKLIKADSFLTNDERIELRTKLDGTANGSKRKYANILKDYLSQPENL